MSCPGHCFFFLVALVAHCHTSLFISLSGIRASTNKHICRVLATWDGIFCDVFVYIALRRPSRSREVKVRSRDCSCSDRVRFSAHVHRSMLRLWSHSNSNAMVKI